MSSVCLLACSWKLWIVAGVFFEGLGSKTVPLGIASLFSTPIFVCVCISSHLHVYTHVCARVYILSTRPCCIYYAYAYCLTCTHRLRLRQLYTRILSQNVITRSLHIEDLPPHQRACIISSCACKYSYTGSLYTKEYSSSLSRVHEHDTYVHVVYNSTISSVFIIIHNTAAA